MNFLTAFLVIRKIVVNVKRTTSLGKPARWMFNKHFQQFKVTISCQVEKQNVETTNISDGLVIFAGNQGKGALSNDGGDAGTKIKRGVRKAVSVIW